MLKSLLLRLVRSRRVAFAVFGNGMFSLANFAISISIARMSSISTFGAFSFAMVTYLFSSGLIRAAFINTALSRPRDLQTFNQSFQRTSLISFIISVLILIWGLFSENSFLIVLAASLHGLLALDFIRIIDSAVGNKIRSFTATAIWSAVSLLASISALFFNSDPLIVFSTWALSGAVCGYILTLSTHAPIFPYWARNRDDTRTSLFFTADYLVGGGGSHLTSGLLGFMSDGRILGAVRGAGTLLGPMNLIATTAQSLLLPFLAGEKNHPDRQIRSALAAAGAQIAALAPLLIILQFIPDRLGEQLLGDTWELAQLAILPMSIDSLCAVIMAPAVSGHRVAFAGLRSLSLQVLLGLPRLLLVLFCASAWGVIGAAWAMAGVAIVGSIIWWVSYIDLCRRKSPSI